MPSDGEQTGTSHCCRGNNLRTLLFPRSADYLPSNRKCPLVVGIVPVVVLLVAAVVIRTVAAAALVVTTVAAVVLAVLQ